MSAPAAEQLELFGPRPAADVHARLMQDGGMPVHLTLTRNTVAMVSMRFVGGGVRLRLNVAFLAAPDPVLAALGAYLRTRQPADWAVVRRHAASLDPASRPGRSAALPTRGQVHDLQAIRDQVNQRFFNGRLHCRIGWGRGGQARRRRVRTRSIRFGSYVRAENLVRINPILDDVRVPPEFVEYIVFHEMLHAVAPIESAGGRRAVHHATFRELERRYPDWPRMRKLSTELVRTLTTARPVE